MALARRLALARLVSLSGGSAAYIALVAALYSETGSALWISAAIFSSVVASVVAAPFAGWVGDHFDRRRVLITTDLAAAIVFVAMAAIVRHPVLLVVMVGLSSIVQAPFGPASAAALPSVVGTTDLARANALVGATSSAAYLAGPLLGGTILSVGASAAVVFLTNAATFVFSAVLVSTIRRPFGRGSTTEHPGVLAGARLVVNDPALRVPVLAGMVSLVGIGIVDVASYPLSLDLHGGSSGYGAMTALLGGGGLLGAALSGRTIRANPVRALALGFGAGAAGLLMAGIAPVLAVALAGMAVAGVGRGLGDVASVTLLQSRTIDEVRSRVFAAEEGAAHVAFSVSAFTGGLLVSVGGARTAFLTAAAFGISAAVIAGRSAPGAAHSDSRVGSAVVGAGHGDRDLLA